MASSPPKDALLNVRVSRVEVAYWRKLARYRYLRGAGMQNASLAEYIRYLIGLDHMQALASIQKRRTV